MISIPTLAALLLFFIVVFILCYKKIYKEDYSYHFGFPTWGNVYNRFNYPQNLYNYNAINYNAINPFMLNYYPNYVDDYMQNSVYPYMTPNCYPSSKNDSCMPGYYKISDKNKKCKNCDKNNGTWKCCRNWW